MRTTDDPKRSWGVTYCGTGDLDVAAAAVEEASEIADMDCRRRAPSIGIVEIEAVQRASWHQVLRKSLPQHADWRLFHVGGGLEIRADFRKFRWHRALVSILWALIALGVLGVLWSDSRESTFDWTSVELTGYVSVVLVLFMAVAYFSIGGGHHVDDLWQTVLMRVEESGGFLEPSGGGVSRRNAVTYLVLLGFVLALAAWAVADSLKDGVLPRGPVVGVLWAICILVIVLIVAAGVMFFRGETNLRSMLILTGLSTALSFFLYLSPISMWLGFASYPEIPRQLRNGQLLLSGQFVAPSGQVVPVSQIHPDTLELYRAFRVFCWQYFSALGFLLGLAILSFTFLGVYYSVYVARILARLQVNRRRRGVYQRATRGGVALHRFRMIFVAIWMLVSGGLLMGLVFLALCALQAVAPVFSSPELRLAEFSATMLGYALGVPIGESWLDTVVRGGWVLYTLSALALFSLSVGQLFLEQRTRRRRLRNSARLPCHRQQMELERRIDHLRQQAGLRHVKVAVLPEPSFRISACVFGLFRQERFVVVSAECLDRLSVEHVEALLAHEFAHHLEGHCRLDQVLRWLGRLTFVGDGFVLTLQDSWGYEESADRVAVEKLGVSAKTLDAALKIYRSVRAARQQRLREGRDGLRAQSDERKMFDELLSEAPSKMTWRHRWRRSWFFFRQQYFHAMRLHYWYPPRKERSDSILASGLLEPRNSSLNGSRL